MARYPNPYAGDPAIAEITSNLVRAFVDKDPGRTRLQRLQGDKLQTEMGRRKSVADVFRSLNGRAPTPEEYSRITGDAIEGGMDGDVWKHNLGYVSNTGQPVSAVGRAFIGTGKTIGENDGLSVEDRESVAARADKARAQRSAIAAGPGYASVAEQRRNNQARLEYDKQFPSLERAQGRSYTTELTPDERKAKFFPPHNIPRDTDMAATPGDPRVSGPRVQGRASPPTPSTIQGAILDYYYKSGSMPPNGQAVLDASRRAVAPPAPLDVSAPEVNAIEDAIVTRLGIGVIDKNTGKIVGIDPEFAKVYGDRLQKARLAAALAYQQTRNAVDGEMAYLRELGVEPGDTWGPDRSGGTYIVSNPPKALLDKEGKPKGKPQTVRDAFQPQTGAPSPARAGAPPAARSDAVGAPPIEKLKPGVVTKFGNGQEWTIGPDGKAQRVK